MAALSDLLDRVVDEYPSVPEVLALRALSDSVKEFCARTHVWQGAPESITRDSSGGSKFSLVAGEGLQVAQVLRVRVAGKSLDPVPAMDRRMDRDVGEPRHFAQWTPSLIEIDVPPMMDAVVEARVALTLAQGATETPVPDELVAEYGEHIAAGAKMRLVRQAGQAWHNPEAGILYGGIYYNAISTAKAQAMSSRGAAELRVEMRPFA